MEQRRQANRRLHVQRRQKERIRRRLQMAQHIPEMILLQFLNFPPCLSPGLFPARAPSFGLQRRDSNIDITFQIIKKMQNTNANIQSTTNIIRRTDEVEQVPYQPVNSYNQSASIEQILTIVLFVAITALHGIFITSAAVPIGSSILWVLVGMTYVLLVVIGYDYIILTCTDPVDDLLLKVKRDYRQSQILFCRDCNSQVHHKSHHCRKCNRCTQHFDHHCKYLNNCIGGKNYHSFLRMLLAVTAFCLSIIFSAIWVFIADSRNAQVSILSRWGALVTLIITVIAMVAVDSLLCFHFYLIFYLKSTTLEYIRSLPDSEDERNQG